MRKVLAIGDMHLPWIKRRTVNAIYDAVEQHKPDVIIQMGDLYDMFSQTRFAKTMSLYTPDREIEVAREGAEEFWHRIQKIRRKAKCIQLKGNHDDRPYKRMLEKAPELQPFFSTKQVFTFDNVETIYDTFEELIIDKTLYTHGHYSKLGAHMRYYLKNVVCGHSHSGGLHVENIHEHILWELNVGYVADKMAVPLRYRPTKTVKWTQGYGLIDEFGPRFIPLEG